jgi:aminoglycoside phosphotransferase (APT) family kinase protein
MAGFSQVITLSGFSGAEVALLRTPVGALFVRKAARDADSGRALRRQAQRQQWLKTVIAGSANVPDVIAQGEVEGLYFFDMPFVASRDAVAFLSSATFDELGQFADRVETLLAALSRAEPEPGTSRPATKDAVFGKLDEIAMRTGGRFARELEPLYRATAALVALADAGAARPTAAHGDLTFENILVGRKGQLWLIDTIESPFDHYWLDWSKLFQDCEGRWHMHRGRPISVSVTWWLRNRWMDAAARLAPDYPSRHYLLLALTFARILPYARSARDSEYVAGRVAAYGRAAMAELMKGST